jgi:hypothetical protein
VIAAASWSRLGSTSVAHAKEAAGGKQGFSATVFVAGHGGHFAKADVFVDPNDAENPIKVKSLDQVNVGTTDSHKMHDVRLDGTKLFDEGIQVKGLSARQRTRPVPPWSRVLAMHVETLRPLPDGEVGLLAHWDLANVPTVLAVITDNLGYTTDGGRGCEMVGRAKIENGKVSPLPDEKPISAMGDSAIFRMLETYVNFSIELKMLTAKDPKVEPSIHEEIEARPGSVASCPQVVDEILVSQSDAEAARLRDAALDTFREQTERPLEWFRQEAERQRLADHPAGLQSEVPGPGPIPGGK